MIELGDVKAPEPSPGHGQPPWQDPDWLAAVDDWITESCVAAGLTRTGPGQARCRMYSVVVRVPVVGGGQVWFKANPAVSAFEPALGHALSRWRPQDAPPVLAVCLNRAWSLTRDLGARLDTTLAANPDIRLWFALLRRYARLQIDLSTRQTELAALGLPDLRPHLLADTAEAMFADPGLIEAVGTPDGPSPEEFAAARDHLPILREQCGELDSLGIPASVDHSDLHAGNILGSGDDLRPFDWGDAVLGHPFGSLLIVLRSAPESCGLPIFGPAIAELRDAYLAPWIAEGIDPDKALRAVDLALITGALARAQAWGRVFPCFSANLETRANTARWLAHIGVSDPLA
jgi:hypothetical protein